MSTRSRLGFRVALGAILGFAVASPASATLLVTFSPAAAGLAAGVANFQSDNQNGADTAFAQINNATGAFTESGVLRYDVFDNGITALSSATTGLRNPGTPTYGLYLSFTATGTLTGFSPGSGGAPPSATGGTFSSVAYNLFGDPGSNDTLNGATTSAPPDVNGVAPPGVPAGDVMLASGGGVIASAVSINTLGVPTASVLLGLTQAGTGFFAAPSGINQFQASFTNSPGTFTAAGNGTLTDLQITGSFNGNFVAAAIPAPEPASSALLGAGLLGLGFAARRRRSF